MGFDKYNIALFLHISIATLLTLWISLPLHVVAQTMMLPLAGIFVGLSFAWAGNAQALLQSEEIEKIYKHHNDGLENYVYTFQTAILSILIALVGWGLAGLKAFDATWLSCFNLAIEWMLYFLSSIAFRECWQVILGSQILILMRHEIRSSNKVSASEDDGADEHTDKNTD